MAKGVREVKPASQLAELSSEHIKDQGLVEGEMMLDVMTDPITTLAKGITDYATMDKAGKVIKEDIAESDFLATDDSGKFVESFDPDKQPIRHNIQQRLKDWIGPSITEETKAVTEEILAGLNKDLIEMGMIGLEEMNQLIIDHNLDSETLVGYYNEWLQSDIGVVVKDKDGNIVPGSFQHFGYGENSWLQENYPDYKTRLNKTRISTETDDVSSIETKGENLIPVNDRVKTKVSDYYENTYGGNPKLALNEIKRNISSIYTTNPNFSRTNMREYANDPNVKEIINTAAHSIYKKVYG